ncbi:helix-turn-helix domain-containing protein [Hyalangium sp.]|uniref:helix-turn-helix domain-containing protein n=1 Tax=Hyalangium sp. TaxID=2028555 RepID=UPI002D5CAD0A|nr:helix-turn-helix domain-containing protein [Hyalangium sp.]HYH97755.1 helix-turn-helix domain-containing protein [Hyalangium sp.]
MRDSPPRQKFATQLGAAAREARGRVGLTQAEVAQQAGVAMEVYGRIERGALLPSIQTFLALCRVLAADPRVLLGLMDSGSPSGPQRAPEASPRVQRLMSLARELSEEEVGALLAVAKVMLAGRSERRKEP